MLFHQLLSWYPSRPNLAPPGAVPLLAGSPLSWLRGGPPASQLLLSLSSLVGFRAAPGPHGIGPPPLGTSAKLPGDGWPPP